MPGHVRWNHARQIVRLVGEGHEIGRGSSEAWQHLVNGLCELLGARFGTLAEMSTSPPAEHGTIARNILSPAYRGDSSAGRIVQALTARIVTNPAASAILQRLGPDLVVTASRRELVPDRAWYRSSFVNEYVRPAHQDDCLFGVCADGRGSSTGLAFVKEWGEAPFSEEERDALHLFMSECAAGFARRRLLPHLAPRVRATLELLLAGHADKDIAARLAISPHTVRDYVKVIFRTYGVSSRAQLLARSLR